MKLLNFKDSVAELDLPTLNNTAKYQGVKGNLPKSRPIEHAQFLHEIIENIERNTNLKTELSPIYASERQAMRVMWEGDPAACPVENYLIQRIATRIQLKDNFNKMNSSVGISYTEKGIQICYGINVQVCSNMLIWGGNLMSTFGQNKMPYDRMLDAFDDWMLRHEEKRDKNKEIIIALKNREVSDQELFEVLGKLAYSAERSNHIGGNGSSLNNTQVSRLIDNIYDEGTANGELVTRSAWDLTQWGTNNLKADQEARDLTKIYDTTHKFSNTIVEQFLPEINLN